MKARPDTIILNCVQTQLVTALWAYLEREFEFWMLLDKTEDEILAHTSYRTRQGLKEVLKSFLRMKDDPARVIEVDRGNVILFPTRH